MSQRQITPRKPPRETTVVAMEDMKMMMKR